MIGLALVTDVQRLGFACLTFYVPQKGGEFADTVIVNYTKQNNMGNDMVWVPCQIVLFSKSICSLFSPEKTPKAGVKRTCHLTAFSLRLWWCHKFHLQAQHLLSPQIFPLPSPPDWSQRWGGRGGRLRSRRGWWRRRPSWWATLTLAGGGAGGGGIDELAFSMLEQAYRWISDRPRLIRAKKPVSAQRLGWITSSSGGGGGGALWWE